MGLGLAYDVDGRLPWRMDSMYHLVRGNPPAHRRAEDEWGLRAVQ
jgi:hypothetical protein